VDAAVKDAISVHKCLVTLTPTNHLKLVKVHTHTHKVDPAKLKGWYYKNNLVFIVLPLWMLNFFAAYLHLYFISRFPYEG